MTISLTNQINNKMENTTTTQSNFETFPTVEMAWKNGTGDQLWMNESGFIFVSRHDDLHDTMIENGFELAILNPQKSYDLDQKNQQNN